MMVQHDGIESLSRLMVTDLQKGFKHFDAQLTQDFESVVVRFQHLFRPEVVWCPDPGRCSVS
jgi:hypothetical protein